MLFLLWSKYLPLQKYPILFNILNRNLLFTLFFNAYLLRALKKCSWMQFKTFFSSPIKKGKNTNNKHVAFIPLSRHISYIRKRFSTFVLSVQNVLSGSGRAELRLMGKCIGHRLVAPPEPDNTFWTDSTIINFLTKRYSCTPSFLNIVWVTYVKCIFDNGSNAFDLFVESMNSPLETRWRRKRKIK